MDDAPRVRDAETKSFSVEKCANQVKIPLGPNNCRPITFHNITYCDSLADCRVIRCLTFPIKNLINLIKFY